MLHTAFKCPVISIVIWSKVSKVGDKKFTMGLIKKLFRKKPSYRAPEELGIHPGQVRYKIYQGFSEGYTSEQIYVKLSGEGEFKNQGRSDALRYIDYFYRRMRGEER